MHAGLTKNTRDPKVLQQELKLGQHIRYLSLVIFIMSLEAKQRKQGSLSPKSYLFNLCQVNCSLVVELLVFINKLASVCSLWSLVVEILVFLNKFAPLCSLRCLVGPNACFKVDSRLHS